MSLSDISDLTNLSSDEEDVPLSKRTSKTKKAFKEYKITNVLRAPRTAQYTAKSLYDQIIDNAIDLDPEYQRAEIAPKDIVWQEEKQSGLIDSLLRNYYIPPIIFAVTVQDDGSELRTCIDGKQRLTSIQRFIDGQIPHKDSFTNEKLWYKSSAANAKRRLLPPHLRTQFSNKQIVCVEYTGLDKDQEREIFQRVQLGVALTPAERLQALVGPWSTVIHEIQNQVLGEEGFEGYLDWGHTRGRDFQCLATIGYLIENHPKTTVPGTKTLEKWLQKPQHVSTQLRADLHDTFRIFVILARDKKYSGSLNRPTRVSPIEFVTIGVLIYLKRKTLSLTQISSAIEKMRKDVRASHQDIRSNSRVTKHLMEFMTKKIKVSELKSDGDGDKPAAQALAKVAKPAKRKRPAHSDESDSEPPANLKATSYSVSSTTAAATKPASQTSGARDQQTNGTKKIAVVPTGQSSSSAKPPQPAKSSRQTNNSMSILLPDPSKKLAPPTPTTQTSRSQTPSLPTSNGLSAPPNIALSNVARHTPLTVQTGSAVKVESPSMNSPVTTPAFDRLAPIRAAKASLVAGTGGQSPDSHANEAGAIVGASANTPQTLVDSRQILAAPQTTMLPQRHPLPPPPTSQALPVQPVQTIPQQVEGVLQAIRSNFSQFNLSTGSMSSAENASPPMSSTPGVVGTGGTNGMPYPSQGYGISTPQGTYNGNIVNAPANSNQASWPYGQWPSSSSSAMSGNVVPPRQPPPPNTNYPIPIPYGPTHGLPQRPAALANTPNISMRAQPLGPPPGSASSESMRDSRRGHYNSDRRRPPDDRRLDRRDHKYDNNRGRRTWYQSRS